MTQSNALLTAWRLMAILLLALLVTACGPELPEPAISLQSPIETPVATSTPARDPTATPTLPRATSTPAIGWRVDNVRVVRHSPMEALPGLLNNPENGFSRPVFAPSGERLLLEYLTGQYFRLEEKGGVALVPRSELWLVDGLDRPNVHMTRLIADARGAAWSPDGSRIAYIKLVGPWQYDLWIMNEDGSNQTKLIERIAPRNLDWGTNGIFYIQADSRLLYQVSPDGIASGPLLPMPVIGGGVAYLISPNGRMIVVIKVWNSAEVINLDSGDAFYLPGSEVEGISISSGLLAWSLDSRYLAYYNSNGTLLVLDTNQQSLVNRMELGYGKLAWSPDGESLMVVLSDRGQASTRIVNREAEAGDWIGLLINADSDTVDGAWAPNGRWLVQTRSFQKTPLLTELALINQPAKLQKDSDQ